MQRILCVGRVAPLLSVLLISAISQQPKEKNVFRATLDNGLRVVVVQDPLAPVATVELNYMAGANETPPGFPGMAHALEHMAFRGCAGLSADQIAAIYAQLGGTQNADTQQDVTQYFVTVPVKDLEVALRVNAACMQDIDISPAQWDEERGAIEQEVSRDISNPTYKFITRMNEDLFAGTVYAHDPLGTRPSFDATTAAMLKKFYQDWYAPNNAILVITGDVNPAETLAEVTRLFGPIPRRPLPPKPAVNLQPVKPAVITLESDLPYKLIFLAFRMPGSDSPDFAATQILSDVISSQRAELYDLVPQGKALATAFGLAETYRKASVGYALAAIAADADPAPVIAEIKRILNGYAAKGVPPELVAASQKSEVAQAEFQRNSIPDLASAWSQALAAEGRNSPLELVREMQNVTVADVDRVAKNTLLIQNAVIAILNPSASGAPVSGKGFGGSEITTAVPTKPVKLPAWAEKPLNTLKIPQFVTHPTDMMLPNGLRLIVQTETITPTVTVIGEVKHEPALQVPPGEEGVNAVLNEMFSYGTTTRDRLAFQKALDDIAASESGGTKFNLKVLKQYFDNGVDLLADNELHPALRPDAFLVVRKQTAELVKSTLESPEYRTTRALKMALLPKNDPALREASPKTVSSLTPDELSAYYAKVFRPDMTTITVIGDITPEEARTVVEKWFGGWHAAGPKPDVTLPPVPPNRPASVYVPDASAVQDTVALAEELGINRFSPDYYPLQLGDHVLGGGFYATRLYRDLRQNTGYVYNVESNLNATKTRGTYAVEYGCDPQNVSKARLLIEGELAAMRSTDVGPAELQQAKALMLRQLVLDESSESEVAGGFLERALIGLPLDEPARASARYYALTANQIREAFEKWIRPGDLVQAVRGPVPQ